MPESPRRGEVWLVTLGAGRAGEPGTTRPAVVVSSNEVVTGDADDLIVVVPLSSSRAPSGLRIAVPPDSGLLAPSRAICRAVQAVVTSRLVRRVGHVDATVMGEIEPALAMILQLGRAPAA